MLASRTTGFLRSLFIGRASSQMYVGTLTRDKAQAEKEAGQLLDKLYHEVRAQRFSEIVVIQTKSNANPRFLILANAFNSRHLLSGTEMINKHYKLHMKTDDQDFADLSISKDWNVLDFHSVVVHLFSEKCRKHFDVDQLWAVGEKYDDHCQGRIKDC